MDDCTYWCANQATWYDEFLTNNDPLCCDYEQWTDGTTNCYLYEGDEVIKFGDTRCENDDSTGDFDGDTCSEEYDNNPQYCGNYDTDEF